MTKEETSDQHSKLHPVGILIEKDPLPQESTKEHWDLTLTTIQTSLKTLWEIEASLVTKMKMKSTKKSSKKSLPRNVIIWNPSVRNELNERGRQRAKESPKNHPMTESENSTKGEGIYPTHTEGSQSTCVTEDHHSLMKTMKEDHLVSMEEMIPLHLATTEEDPLAATEGMTTEMMTVMMTAMHTVQTIIGNHLATEH
jgi:hypothetical protein